MRQQGQDEDSKALVPSGWAAPASEGECQGGSVAWMGPWEPPPGQPPPYGQPLTASFLHILTVHHPPSHLTSVTIRVVEVVEQQQQEKNT